MIKISVSGYEVFLEWDSGDEIYVASCAAFPGCMVHGSDIESVVNEMKTAISEHLKLAKKLER